MEEGKSFVVGGLSIIPSQSGTTVLVVKETSDDITMTKLYMDSQKSNGMESEKGKKKVLRELNALFKRNSKFFLMNALNKKYKAFVKEITQSQYMPNTLLNHTRATQYNNLSDVLSPIPPKTPHPSLKRVTINESSNQTHIIAPDLPNP